jgi:hypothetical protein
LAKPILIDKPINPAIYLLNAKRNRKSQHRGLSCAPYMDEEEEEKRISREPLCSEAN